MIVRFVRFMVVAALIVLFYRGAGLDAAQMTLDGQRISDSVGRRILVDKPFQRIISLYGAHTENLFSLGAHTRVIGVTRNDDWPPEAKTKPVHSYHDGLEKFLAVKPDLVLIRPMIDRGYPQLVHRLQACGITVISLQPSTPRQMFVYWKILGTLTGTLSTAQEMIFRFNQAAQCIQQRTAAITRKKRVYFESIHDRMRTFAPTAMPIFVLETAGGINVAGDAVPRKGTAIADYGKERILSRGDDIDLYLAQVGPMNRPTRKIIKTEPGYDLIRAVRQDEICLIDEKLVARPTMRLLKGIQMIGRMLYPHHFDKNAQETACDTFTGD